MKKMNEDIRIEYKEEISKRLSEFKAEIVSFLNTDPGGIIYLGVTDEREKINHLDEAEEFQQRQEWESKISNWLSDGFAPNVHGLIEIRPNDKIFNIVIHSGPEKPYYYTDGKGLNTKGIYIRSGSTKRRASDEEVRNLIFRSSRKAFDLEDSPIQDLTFRNLENKLIEENREFDVKSLRLRNNNNNFYNNFRLVSRT